MWNRKKSCQKFATLTNGSIHHFQPNAKHRQPPAHREDVKFNKFLYGGKQCKNSQRRKSKKTRI